jgi:heme-degrading monooxygenase HmoA
LVDAMRCEARALAAESGFLCLAAWTGQAGDYRVIVEGRWRSRDAFEAAVARDPGALEARARLEQHGQASPGMFVQSLQVLPSVVTH